MGWKCVFTDYDAYCKATSRIWRDGEGNEKIITTQDVRAVNDLNKYRRDRVSSKAIRIFNPTIRDGDRVIASLPALIAATHPEFVNDAIAEEKGFKDHNDAALKWLDANPQWKAIDVGWTYVKRRYNTVGLNHDKKATTI